MAIEISGTYGSEMQRNQSEFSQKSFGFDMQNAPFVMNTAELLPESCDEFSTAPFDFEESTKILWEDTQLTYYHACSANRFTEQYLALCRRLEKNIKQVGSLCVTKAVLEKSGLLFPDLSEMNIDELIGMVSYHLRKCHATFRSVYQCNNYLGMSYLNWEFRWVELGNRLKSTNVKIQEILDGKVNIERMIQKEKPRETAEMPAAVKIPQNLPINPVLMPIDGSLVRKILSNRKEEEKRQRDIQKHLNELQKIWSGDSSYVDGFESCFEKEIGNNRSASDPLHGAGPIYAACFPNPEPGKESEFLTTEEARKILMADAESRNDRKALEEIPGEDAYALMDRWIDFTEPPLEEDDG